MYYTESQGLQNAWRNRADAITEKLNYRQWVPVAVGGIMVAWVALIITALQSPFTPVTVPDTTNATVNGNNLTVVPADISDSQNVRSVTNGTATSGLLDITGLSAASVQTNSVGSIADYTNAETEQPGGRGADTNGGGAVPTSNTESNTPGQDEGGAPDSPPTSEGTPIDVEVTVPATPITEEIPLDVEVDVPILDTSNLL